MKVTIALAVALTAVACSKKSSSDSSGTPDGATVTTTAGTVGGGAGNGAGGGTGGTLTPPPLGTFAVATPTGLTTSTPTVSWSASTSATSYTLTIGNDSSCTNPLATYAGLTGTSQALSAVANGTHHICVTAKDGSDHTLAATNNGLAFTVGATLALGQPDMAAVQNLQSGVNGPNAVAGDATHLIVADTYNNRILIYNKIPTGNTPVPDVVLGQSSVAAITSSSTFGSITGTTLSNPGGVAYDGTRLFVADTGNNRVLIWNSLPSTNDKAPDVVLGQGGSFTTGSAGSGAPKGFYFPVAVHSDGVHLFVSDSQNHRVQIYAIPTANNDPSPAVSLSVNDPRGLFSDGTNLYVADASKNRVLVWNGIPTSNSTAASQALGQANLTSTGSGNSTTQLSYPTAVFGHGSRIYVGDSQNSRVLVYPTPATTNEAATVALGNNGAGPTAQSFSSPSGLWSDGTHLVVADSGYNRVFIWDNASTLTNAEAANVVIGQPDFATTSSSNSPASGVSLQTLNQPSSVCGNGNMLSVTDTGNNRVLVWTSLPASNDQPADLILGYIPGGTVSGISSSTFLQPVYACPVGQGSFAVVDGPGNRVLIWNSALTTNSQAADVVLGQTDPDSYSSSPATPTGATLKSPTSVFGDSTHLVVTDNQNNRVLIWDRAPSSITNDMAADHVVGQSSMSGHGNATTQSGLYWPSSAVIVGSKLIVADSQNHRVLIWNSIPTTDGANADLVLGQTDFTSGTGVLSASGFWWPTSVWSDGTKLYVTDQNANRVLVWNSFPTTNGQAADAVLGQADMTTGSQPNAGGLGPTTFYKPVGVFGDAQNLYVADYGNDRVMVYPH